MCSQQGQYNRILRACALNKVSTTGCSGHVLSTRSVQQGAQGMCSHKVSTTGCSGHVLSTRSVQQGPQGMCSQQGQYNRILRACALNKVSTTGCSGHVLSTRSVQQGAQGMCSQQGQYNRILRACALNKVSTTGSSGHVALNKVSTTGCSGHVLSTRSVQQGPQGMCSQQGQYNRVLRACALNKVSTTGCSGHVLSTRSVQQGPQGMCSQQGQWYSTIIFSLLLPMLPKGEVICFHICQCRRSATFDTQYVYPFVILQIKLWESHWLSRRVYGFIFTSAAVYMARVTSRKPHCDVMKIHCSWRHSNFFPYNFQTSGIFLSPQRLSC